MKRLECLDGLRGVLAVYVMLSHMAPFAPLPAWIALPLRHGGAAVDVFFILSGLVIMASLERFAYRPGPFLLARAARIYPVFLVVFALALVVHAWPAPLADMPWLGPDSLAWRMWAGGWPSHWPVDVLAHLTMTHGLFPDGILPHVWISLLGAAWSLSTEWQFYILALVLAGWLARRGPGSVPWRLGWVFVAIAVAGATWAALAPPEWRFSRAFLGNKAAYFALGVASVLVVRDGARAIGGYGATLVAVLALCWAQGGWGKLAAPLVWTLCLAAQVAPRGPLAWLSAALRQRTMQWLGALSYGIYLVNEPVQRLLGLWLVPLVDGDVALFTLLWLPTATLLPVLAAAWLHAWVEVPGQRWGRAMATQPMRAPPTRPHRPHRSHRHKDMFMS
jgi:peptidoglycan/LPS O-acetylase OafA/YrhL